MRSLLDRLGSPRWTPTWALGLIVVALPALGEAALLVDVSAAVGLDFQHFNGMTGALFFPEMTGQGAALLDYDGDGDLDVYLVQGSTFGAGLAFESTLDAPPDGGRPRDRLLRNDLHRGPDGRAEPQLVDVTEASGLRATGYGMGVAVGDVDGDGWLDLYLTNYGPNQLWHNLGDGRFEETTAAAGVGEERWSASASFLDVDGDGWLDLYVANYVQFSVAENPSCYAQSSRRDYCGPSAFRGVGDRLFRNRGDGSFDDLSAALELERRGGSGLGVVSLDVEDDGLVDWVVANDGEPNFFWHNRGGGQVTEDGLFAGVALNGDGQAEASMGVDAADFDRDGDEDLVFAHLAGESNTLLVDQGGGLFEDRSRRLGLASPSLSFTSFGIVFADFDRDGWLDLAVASGAVRILEDLAAAGDDYPLEQPNQLYRNFQGERFEDVTSSWAPAFLRAEVSRGLVDGDLDLDGDPDLLVVQSRGKARLFASRPAAKPPWSGVIVPASSGPTALGTRVLFREGERERAAFLRRDGSFASSREPRPVQVWQEPGRVELTLRWPRGKERRIRRPPPDRYLVVPSPQGPRPEARP